MKILKKIAVAIFIIIFTIFMVQPSFADPPLPTPVGRVVWIKGTLKAIMPNNEQRILQKTSVIYLHDTLMTDANTQAQIVFTDNTLMTFRPNTRFYINNYVYKTDKKGTIGKYFMNLLEGGFRTITGLIAKNNPSDYQVKTPVATIGVRGTDYAVYLQKGKLSMVFYKGTPCMANGSGSLCLTETKPYGQVILGKAPVAVKEVPEVLKDKQEIVVVKIAPFVSGEPPTTPTAGGGEVTTDEMTPDALTPKEDSAAASESKSTETQSSGTTTTTTTSSDGSTTTTKSAQTKPSSSAPTLVKTVETKSPDGTVSTTRVYESRNLDGSTITTKITEVRAPDGTITTTKTAETQAAILNVQNPIEVTPSSSTLTNQQLPASTKKLPAGGVISSFCITQ